MTDNRRYLWILTLLTGSFLFGQDQRIADSLIVLYESESYPGNRLELLETIAEEETDPEEALRYSELLIANSTEDSLAPYRYSGYLQKGNALARLGKLDEALEEGLNSGVSERTTEEIFESAIARAKNAKF